MTRYDDILLDIKKRQNNYNSYFEFPAIWSTPYIGDITRDIKQVIFNNPATIIIWKDGSKTVVKCQEGDVFDKEKGLAMCIVKKLMGNKGNYNNLFKKWCGEDK